LSCSFIINAKESIDFLAFAFTNKKISDALKEQHDKGVVIRGVFDKEQHEGFLKRYSKFDTLLSHKIDVKLDGNKQTMHNKVFIIDHKTVVTGSYNFTVKANEDNSENAIVVHNREFASRYKDEFEEIFDLAN
jgi:phosphatidylserine/phosphatidylglycerophosphate/cardiolipin synthase-like enzyme